MAVASPASADQVWQQSVGRASEDAACPTSDPVDLATGWSEWTASWEQWANDGTGGYVCSRSITWAKDTPPPVVDSLSLYPSGGCINHLEGGWLNFAGGWWVDGTTLSRFDDAECSGQGQGTFQIVYAPSGFDPESLCLERFGNYTAPFAFLNDVYRCSTSY